jgi:protein subunit release factor B
MVKDHRLNLETGNVHAVMDGDLDQFIDAALIRGLGGAGGRKSVEETK